MYIKKITLLFFISILLSCNSKSKHIEIEPTIVKLEKKEGKHTFFSPIENTIQFLSQHSRYPKYYQNLFNNSGFEQKDSLIISFLRTNYNAHVFKLFKKNYISKKEFITYGIDSLKYQNTPKVNELLVGIQFKDNSQILYVDENNNGNFKDEKPIVFKSDFRKQNSDSLNLEAIPSIDYNYWVKEENNITSFKRKAIIYPSFNDYRFSETNDEISKKSRLILKFKDYWVGKAVFDGLEYIFIVQGYFKSNFSLYIKPSTESFDSKNTSKNQNFKYEIKDSVKLGNKIFVLEDISNDLTNLKIKEIKGKEFIYGNKIGQKIKNYELKNLTLGKEKLEDILKEKKYTIIDFWGTWCKPCVEQIPLLKEFYIKNKDEIGVVSIAYDKKLNDVIEFTNKKEMKWPQYFYDRNTGTGIIDDLRIIYYPTLLLVDNEMNILYKESGTSNLDDLNQFLNYIK